MKPRICFGSGLEKTRARGGGIRQTVGLLARVFSFQGRISTQRSVASLASR